jgi:hypothetical protein
VTSWHHDLVGIELHDGRALHDRRVGNSSSTVTCDVRAGLLCGHCVVRNSGGPQAYIVFLSPDADLRLEFIVIVSGRYFPTDP